ncbi:MAG: HAD-IA family hydrolase [Bacteriovoracaceae bacterium]|nr:HAD-IA family hydrolase [Bacteriovoracaceae bacterium]
MFDFDGVLNDSVGIKTNAFLEAYKDDANSKQLDMIREYHLRHGGVNRTQKFRYFEEEVMCRSVQESKIQALINTFEESVEKGLKGDTLFSGVKFCLKKINKLNLISYIVSGAPSEEILEVLKRNEIDQYFSEVYGGNNSKETHIKNILMRENLSPSDIIFLGDSLTDYDAAVACDLDFLAINANFPPQEKEVKRFSNIKEFGLELEQVLSLR